MIPLALVPTGQQATVLKVGGNPEMKKHLEDLGFVGGGVVEVVSEMAGDLVVNVKGSRIAISRELAVKIMTR